MNYYPVFLVKSIQTDGQTESGAYEPTLQNARVGSKTAGSTSPARHLPDGPFRGRGQLSWIFCEGVILHRLSQFEGSLCVD